MVTAEKTIVSASGTESVLLHVEPNNHDYHQHARNITNDLSRRLVGDIYAGIFITIDFLRNLQ